MQYEYILMVIPIIIIVAFLVVIAKRMTDGERPDISGAVLGTIIIAVGLLIMVPIISSVDPQYEYDDEDKTFTLYKNVTGTEFSWGSAANAESLIIEDTVTTISAGAFASFTDLKYISIPESLETIGEGALPTLKDCLDQTITDPEAGEYVGFGDGTLYLCDPDVFTYTSAGRDVSGLASGFSSAKHLVIPAENNGIAVTGIARDAFNGKTAIENVLVHPDGETSSLGVNAFSGCSSLARVSFPTVTAIESNSFLGCAALESVYFPAATTIGSKAFSACAALESVYLPAATTISNNVFENCTSLESVSLPEATAIGTSNFSGCSSLASASFPKATSLGLNSLNGCSSLAALEAPELVTIGVNALRGTSITEASFPSVTTLEANAFQSCTSLESVSLPEATAIGSGAFIGCTAIRSVSFGSSLTSVTANAMQNWTFYDSDGTTLLDKTVAANLAGFTFQGTASALVKVLPDRSALTLEQTLKVQELTKEAAKASKLEEAELQISEKAELAEA